ncbi:MAG: RNA polymerase sigma factor [Alphaproteobacteria bacterium]|jgi:RNA polymerase sigma-70 factor (ECF subfamily)|uniref:RNA polymerase sigma factor n=1 Tax=Brevundimonas sp. TaxID=1871086 RepID=UPI001DCD32DA|nr:RNA polymerase sigma factor [Alphaproteobacteria bacterium]MBU1520886.1 RNA polymerase sigma factor [Alphaproteobacteria bacterium]MBU2030844.1 RNA polymerase sigma factor [Alphaproteobacteria bacterium]MBU2165961.1 RNA polymerase sigma factor [Alphaproteobacteria bacterium]MBU2230380.1 RNA polymerase sigma factor [Alphaproteobacteria bacterium]
MGVSDETALWLARSVMPHEPALRAWLRRGASPADVDDIVQETYAKLISIENFAAIQNVRAYLFRTAHSAAVDRLRRQSVVQLEAVADLDRLQVASDAVTPEDEVVDRNELRLLARMIERLPEKTRRIFVLSRVSERSQKQIAQETGYPESTVEKHIAKAFALLMAAYADGGYDAPDASRLRNARIGRRANDRDGNG